MEFIFHQCLNCGKVPGQAHSLELFVIQQGLVCCFSKYMLAPILDQVIATFDACLAQDAKRRVVSIQAKPDFILLG
jgi:hypothetical protein